MRQDYSKQKGAVLLEVAYVLPVMLLVSLFIVEVVSYALNSFVANDILTDVHTAIITEVEQVSNRVAGETLSPQPTYASCVSGEVALPTGSNSSINDIVTNTLTARNVTFSSGPSTVITKTVVSGFNVYVINFSGVANSLVLPDSFSMLLPISVNTVISIKDSCV